MDEVNGSRGLIVCQNTSSDKPYILLQEEDGSLKQFDLMEVRIINSIENKEYDPMHDIVINGKEVFINRHEVLPIACSKKKDKCIVTSDSLVNIPQLKMDSIGGELVVEMANTTGNSRVSLLPVTGSKVKNKIIYSIDNNIFADGYISACSQSVSANNTLRIVYKVEKGLYALYVSEKKNFYFCEVK